MKRRKFNSEFLIGIYQEWLHETNRKRKKAIIERWSNTIHGLTKDVLYARFREFKNGGIPANKRADAGKQRVLDNKKSFTDDMKLIASIKMASTTSRAGKFFKNGRELSTEIAIKIAESKNMVPVGLYKTTTVNRWLSRMGYNSRSILREAASLHLVSEYTNQVWMMDFSPADTIYESEDTHRLVYDRTIHIDKNHAEERLRRRRLRKIQICYMIEMYSGAFDLCCFSDIGLGENTHIFLESLSYFMREKQDSRNVIGKRPTCLYTDQGPVFRSAIAKQVYRYFGIQHFRHEPGGSGTGRVESRIGAIKQKYEKLFYLAYNKESHEGKPIDEFQLFLRNWAVHENIKTGTYSKYVEGLIEHRPITSEDFYYAMTEPPKMTVDSYGEVVFRGTPYFVGWDTVGLKVAVYRDFDGNVKAVGDNDTIYDCTDKLNEVKWGVSHPGKPKSEMVRNQEEIIKKGQEIKRGLRLSDLTPEKLSGDLTPVPFPKREGVVVQLPIKNFTMGTAWQFLTTNLNFQRLELPDELMRDIDKYFMDCNRINGIIQYDNVMKVYAALEKYFNKTKGAQNE